MIVTTDWDRGFNTHSLFHEETDINLIYILCSKFPKVRQWLKWLVISASRWFKIAPTLAKLGEFPHYGS